MAKGYKGNENLKPVNTDIEWTDELLDEYARCALDPIYFTEKYVKIDNLDNGLVDFTLRDYQYRMIDSIINNRYTIFCTARQIGKCCHYDSKIKIKNKRSGKIEEISIGDFYERLNEKK